LQADQEFLKFVRENPDHQGEKVLAQNYKTDKFPDSATRRILLEAESVG